MACRDSPSPHITPKVTVPVQMEKARKSPACCADRRCYRLNPGAAAIASIAAAAGATRHPGSQHTPEPPGLPRPLKSPQIRSGHEGGNKESRSDAAVGWMREMGGGGVAATSLQSVVWLNNQDTAAAITLKLSTK